MTACPPGVILAGGESRRMGRDKALVGLGGRTLLAWAAGRLAPQCGPLAVSRHDAGGAGLAGFALPVVHDDAGGGRAGPLGGLLAGLDWAAAAAPEALHAVTVAVDTPFLPLDLVAKLDAARRAAGARAAVAWSGGRRHPVAALWPIGARHALRDAVRRDGLRRIGLFLDGLGPAAAEWPGGPDDPFANLNGPDDLVAAEKRVAAGADPGQARRD